MSSLRLVLVLMLVSLGGTASASVQTCNTRCQTEQTDCNLRCDGDIPCIQQCQLRADACSATCGKP